MTFPTSALASSMVENRSVTSVRGQHRVCPMANWLSTFKVSSKGIDFVGRSFDAPAEECGEGHLPAVAHQLRFLIAHLTVFLADFGHAIVGR
jgi:hypothetical protein